MNVFVILRKGDAPSSFFSAQKGDLYMEYALFVETFHVSL